MRSELLQKVSRIVVKLGTGVLTDSGNHPDAAQMKQLVSQLAAQVRAGREVVVVSSGAIGAGMGVLGYARRDRHLLGIGVAFFPVFIVVFYYEWQISLLIKSWIMAGSGAVLLLARWYLSSRSWARELEA